MINVILMVISYDAVAYQYDDAFLSPIMLYI